MRIERKEEEGKNIYNNNNYNNDQIIHITMTG